MYTFQDFQKETNIPNAVRIAINKHVSSDDYKIAEEADLYDKQKNKTIYEYVHRVFSLTGDQIEDFTASNNRIASNFFRRLNTQRATYLLGNGISFAENESIKDQLGESFDTKLKNLAYYALIHGVSFGFWNVNGIHLFKLTEFAPLWDEATGALRAGIRFWRIDDNKPMYAVLYEEDGFTKYKATQTNGEFEETQPKRAYQLSVRESEADGTEVIGEDNYGSLPIIPLWGSALKQSTLIGMKTAIDSFDLIRSGFANDLAECAQIYWIVSNAGGMTDAELGRFRDRIKLAHIATVDTDNSGVQPYTVDIPYDAREAFLKEIRSGIYEDFGALDVHAVEAGATNDHIDAAYQPLDEQADDLEFQVLEFIDHLLALLGIEPDTAIFKRNRISNQMEQTQMVTMAAEWLDEETILKKLPFITVDEVADILEKNKQEKENRYSDEELDRRLASLEQANNANNQEEQEEVNG